jgi:hypothetical protein
VPTQRNQQKAERYIIYQSNAYLYTCPLKEISKRLNVTSLISQTLYIRAHSAKRNLQKAGRNITHVKHFIYVPTQRNLQNAERYMMHGGCGGQRYIVLTFDWLLVTDSGHTSLGT